MKKIRIDANGGLMDRVSVVQMFVKWAWLFFVPCFRNKHVTLGQALWNVKACFTNAALVLCYGRVEFTIEGMSKELVDVFKVLANRASVNM